MPFDGQESEYNIRQCLLARLDEGIVRVRALLDREDRWCKGALHTSDGRHCLIGAMEATQAERLLRPAILCAIGEHTGRYYLRIECFNDKKSTTHADVIAVLDRAARNIRAGMPFGAPVSAKARWRTWWDKARRMPAPFGRKHA